jgi:hypothetical protein
MSNQKLIEAVRDMSLELAAQAVFWWHDDIDEKEAYAFVYHLLKDAEKYEQLWDAAYEVFVANGCGSSEIFDRAIGKLRASLHEAESEGEQKRDNLDDECNCGHLRRDHLQSNPTRHLCMEIGCHCENFMKPNRTQQAVELVRMMAEALEQEIEDCERLQRGRVPRQVEDRSLAILAAAERWLKDNGG